MAKSNDEDTETQNEAALNGNDKNVGSAKKSEKVVKKRVTKSELLIFHCSSVIVVVHTVTQI